jgi:hypothetical protein
LPTCGQALASRVSHTQSLARPSFGLPATGWCCGPYAFVFSYLGARVRELLWGSVCPRKLFERESSLEQGATTTLSRCLVLRLVSSLGAKSVAHHRLALSF